MLKSSLLVMLRRLDEDGSGDIDKTELLGVIDDPYLLEVLDELEVDVNHFIALQEMIYDDAE